MPRLKKGSPPTYRLYKRTGQAVVTIDGTDHYLGEFGTPSSRQKYAGLIRAWEQRRGDREVPHDVPLRADDRPTINEIILSYLRHAAAYYRPNHGENKEAGCIADALAVLQESGYGREPADSFRPRDLKRVRDAMIAKEWSRNYVNPQVNRVRRMFAHAAEQDDIPGTVYHSLLAVKGLRKGTPGVRETRRIGPVPKEDIKKVLERAHPVLEAMLRFAYYTGARPGEVCALKPRHLDRSGRVWLYHVPEDADKTAHHGHDLPLYVGPKAQKSLARWLKDAGPDRFVFSPARAEALRQRSRREARKTPLWPSHAERQRAKKKADPKRPKRDHYDPISFRRAVKRLCDRAGVPAWTPNRLRHNAATRFRKKFGLEAARILLRHRRVTTTQVYAEPDREKAVTAALDLG